MIKLINLSTYKYDMDRFHCDTLEITNLLEKHNIQGVELLNPILWDENIIPKKIIKGVHLKYYPVWLDFWNNNSEELLRQFGNMDEVRSYYGGSTRESMIEDYRKEIQVADKMGAQYVVFHVCHVELAHVYTYDFTYSDEEVIDATADLVNEIFEGLDTNIQILFENLWWPGLTMINKEMVSRLLDKVRYSNKGFMLDTGHLMNTNFNLKDEKQGIQYILDTISNLGELKNYIKGIHLNCSLSGEYVMEETKKQSKCELIYDEIKERVLFHVMKLDMHKPFKDRDVKKIIELVKPEYVIYEFITRSLEEFDEYITTQNEALEIL